MHLLARVMGSAFVLLSGILLGLEYSGRLEERRRELEGLETALLHLETEISYGLTPLPRALSAAGRTAGGMAGEVFVRAGELVGRRGGMTPGDAMKEALCSRAGDVVGEEAREVLLDMASGLGSSGRSEQIALIERGRQRIRFLREAAARRASREGKLYRYLGFLGALALLLLVL